MELTKADKMAALNGLTITYEFYKEIKPDFNIQLKKYLRSVHNISLEDWNEGFKSSLDQLNEHLDKIDVYIEYSITADQLKIKLTGRGLENFK